MSENNNLKQFIDPNQQMKIATAVLPDKYVLGATINQVNDNPRTPFQYSIFGADKPSGVLILATSEEIYLDYRNSFMEQMAKMTGGYKKNFAKDLTDPLIFLHQKAEAVFNGKLVPIASAALPSLNAINLQDSINRMMTYYNTYFMYETQGGLETRNNQIIYQGYMMKYEGVKEGRKYTVLAGMEFKGVECYCPNAAMMQGMMGGMMGGLMGGLFGGAQQKQQPKQGSGSNVFGQGQPCDYVEWGAENFYYLVSPDDVFDEAGNDFLNFVSTYRMDPELYARYDQLRKQILDQGLQVGMMAQAQTQANIINNQYQQQKLMGMLQQNSQQISAGIMDSWNKKMASDSRISQNYSEAIRGVNVYNTTDGRKVDVSVTADHVYQNQYGDVYGVSGNAIDQDILSRINWTELKK